MHSKTGKNEYWCGNCDTKWEIKPLSYRMINRRNKKMEPISTQKISGILALISAFIIVLMNAVSSYGYVVNSIVQNIPAEYQVIGSIVVWIVFIFAILAQWISSIKINNENIKINKENSLLQSQLQLIAYDKDKMLNKSIKRQSKD